VSTVALPPPPIRFVACSSFGCSRDPIRFERASTCLDLRRALSERCEVSFLNLSRGFSFPFFCNRIGPLNLNDTFA
jgi:hypothetical protein